MNRMDISSYALSSDHNEADSLRNLDMGAYLARMDAAMDYAGRFICKPPDADHSANRIGTLAMRVLCLSSMFRDAPLEGQLHPGMQQRLWASMEQMDRAVFDSSVAIAQSGLMRNKEVIAAIKGSDNPGMAFVARLDRFAAQINLSSGKRFRLRSMGIDVVRKMRRQSPEYAFCDAWDRVEQLRCTVELCGSVEEAQRRASTMRVGRDGYRAKQQEISDIMQQWNTIAFFSDSAQADVYTAGDISLVQHRITPGAWALGVAGVVSSPGDLLVLIDPVVTRTANATVGLYPILIGTIILEIGAALGQTASLSKGNPT